MSDDPHNHDTIDLDALPPPLNEQDREIVDDDTQQLPASGTHGRQSTRFSVGHAIFGAVFIAIGLFGLDGGEPGAAVRWISVGLLAAIGIAGLVAVVTTVRRGA
jgi:hypothetical protein